MSSPDVSIVVPSIGTSGTVLGSQRVFLVEALRSVLETTAVHLEMIVVAGRSMPDAVVAAVTELAPAGTVRIVPFDAEFNFSATVNLGAAHARGQHLLLLNDDTQAISPGWLEAMLDASGPGVGAVGARLLFEDSTLQHAGHTYRTSLDHVAFGQPGDAPGRGDILRRRRDVAGVTAACMLTPAAVFDEVGGFTTLLPRNYNDVDYCMKLRHAGHRIVYEPRATLYHFESRSRVAGIEPAEIELIQRRWLSKLVSDPYTPAVV